MARESHLAAMMSQSRRYGAVTIGALVTAACSLWAGNERPAVITQATVASRAELAAAVSAELNGVPVRLADDSLTRDSTLIVERVQPRDAAGRPFEGRQLGKPEHFILVTHGTDCVLIRRSTRKREVLKTARCQPAAGS